MKVQETVPRKVLSLTACNCVATVRCHICKMAAVRVKGVPAGKQRSQNAEGGSGAPLPRCGIPLPPGMQPSLGLPCGGWSLGVPWPCSGGLWWEAGPLGA